MTTFSKERKVNKNNEYTADKERLRHLCKDGLAKSSRIYDVYATKDGHIYRMDCSFIPPKMTSNGYEYVFTPKGYELVHIIMADAFQPENVPLNNRSLAYHKDGIASNNSINNITYSVSDDVPEYAEIVKAMSEINSVVFQGQRLLSQSTIVESSMPNEDDLTKMVYNPQYEKYFTKEGKVFERINEFFFERYIRRDSYSLAFKDSLKKSFSLKLAMEMTFCEKYKKHPSLFEVELKNGNPSDCSYNNIVIKDKKNVPNCIRNKIPQSGLGQYRGNSVYSFNEFDNLFYFKKYDVYITIDGFLLRKCQTNMGKGVYPAMFINGKNLSAIVKGKQYYPRNIIAEFFFKDFDPKDGCRYTFYFKNGDPYDCSVDNLRIKEKTTGKELKRKTEEEIQQMLYKPKSTSRKPKMRPMVVAEAESNVERKCPTTKTIDNVRIPINLKDLFVKFFKVLTYPFGIAAMFILLHKNL